MTKTTEPHWPENTYYPLFDWLRITLAVTVALNHDKVIAWQHAGNLAVQVFFALSGWLIGGILLNCNKADLPRFFFNRVTRIWIPYAVAIALLVCASLIKEPVTPKWIEFIFYKATFVYNLFGSPQLSQFKDMMPLQGTGNHFWSICAEEQFYLLAPLLIVLMPPVIGKSSLLWLLISTIALCMQVYSPIAMGVTAAVAKNHWGDWHLRPKAMIALLLALFISVACLYFPLLATYEYVAPFFSITLVLLLARSGTKNKWAEFLGGMSYPFYLNHWIGVFLAHAIFKRFGLGESAVAKITALSANLLVAGILYYFIDKQIRKYRRDWFSQRRGLISAFAAYGLIIIGLAGGFYAFSQS